MAVEGSLVKKQPISTVGDSMALNLHLAESERPYKAQGGFDEFYFIL